MKRIVVCSLAFLATAPGLFAQSNVVPGLDGRLSNITDFYYWGRRGAAHPNGEVGVSMENTMCNPGAVGIPWYAAMSANHPKFGFLLVRVHNGRLEQINDWSYCKHAFTSTNFSGACGTCSTPGGNVMGVGCSDTYGAGNNGDRYWLGPPEEINPWLGTWDPVGSYFDRGDPPVAGAQATDGIRSLNSTAGFDAVKNRMTIREADLLTPGAQYFYGIQLIHQGEAVANRGDNLASRGCNPSWNGSTWSFANNAAGMTHGSILTRWPGAEIYSGQNGNDDGRFFVAVVVTPLGGGAYHYEYAVHNVDNHRGGATFRLPVDAGATVANFTFGDIDQNPLNDWLGARVGNEIVFTAPANNPQNWNTIFNFGFDCNFPPGVGYATIDEARLGPGNLSVDVQTKVPSGATVAQWTAFGEGCGGVACQTSFYQLFNTAGQFDLANSGWTLTLVGGSYQLGPLTGSYQAPAGTVLTLTDDSQQSVALPFSLPYPGGTTSTLWACSNGYVSAASSNSAYTPSVGEFLGGPRRWAAAWHDFNPGGGQYVRANVTAGGATISYTAIPNFSGGGTATFQYQFLPNGTVHVIYQAVSAAGNGYLAGYTPGNGAPDPGNWDISANLAGGLSLCQASSVDIALAASARPILGTTIDLITSNIPAGTVIGVQIVSLTQFNPGLDLTFLGMPGCELYSDLEMLTPFLVVGGGGVVPQPVPSTPSLAGLAGVAQTLTLSPGINAAEMATSNGVSLLLGAN